jgi:hypothetical protein
MKFENEIPKSVLTCKKEKKIKTVGQLKKYINQLPDGLPVSAGLADHVTAYVSKVNDSYLELQISDPF